MADPDAEARIFRDEALIQLQLVAVPPGVIPGEALRLHFLLQPQEEAHWNNESEPLALVLGGCAARLAMGSAPFVG